MFGARQRAIVTFVDESLRDSQFQRLAAALLPSYQATGRFHRRVVCGICVFMLLGGCGRTNEEFIPPPDVAEGALYKVLSAWKADQPAGEIPNTKPVVYATDTNRQAGQTLREFKVLGETPGLSGRTYVVVLHLENPSQEIKTTYVVVGIDPLWVFRREDYELLMHWDHYMPAPDATTSE